MWKNEILLHLGVIALAIYCMYDLRNVTGVPFMVGISIASMAMVLPIWRIEDVVFQKG